MGLQGRVEGVGLLDFFQLLERSRTGTLSVITEPRTFKFTIHEGAALGPEVQPPVPGTRLLERLLYAEKLTKPLVIETLTLQKREQKSPPVVGQLLVDRSWVSAAGVRAALRCQLKELLLGLFLLRSGDLRFEEGLVEVRGIEPEPINLVSLLIEGINLRKSWAETRRLEPARSVRLLRARPLPEPKSGDLFGPSSTDDPFTADDRRVFELVGEGLVYERLQVIALIDRFTLRSSVVRLLQAGHLATDQDSPDAAAGWADLAAQLERLPPAQPTKRRTRTDISGRTAAAVRPAFTDSHPRAPPPDPLKVETPPVQPASISLRQWRAAQVAVSSAELIDLSHRLAEAALQRRAAGEPLAPLALDRFALRGEELVVVAADLPGAEAVDPRVEVHALGAALYELACGRYPNYQEGAPDPFRIVVPGLDISTTLETVIQRCLSPDPARRYAQLSAVVAALDLIRQAEEAW